jgi:hypothetical protein
LAGSNIPTVDAFRRFAIKSKLGSFVFCVVLFIAFWVIVYWVTRDPSRQGDFAVSGGLLAIGCGLAWAIAFSAEWLIRRLRDAQSPFTDP